MRKLILEIEPNDMIKEAQRPLFEFIHSYEVLEALKIEYEQGLSIELIECVTKDNVSIQDVKSIGKMEILSILKSENNKHICLIKYNEEEDSKDLFKEFDLDLIWTTPNKISEEINIMSCIGENENIKKLIELIKTQIGTIVNMRFQKAAYQKHDILSVLTDKQKEIITTAHKYGYYKYPRKISSEALAQKIGISKGTMVEHLRKAEERLVTNIVEGYGAS